MREITPALIPTSPSDTPAVASATKAHRRAITGLAVAIMLFGNASTAMAGWSQPWGKLGKGQPPSLAVVAGVPYAAWVESDGANAEVRVARLEGSTWVQPWSGVSPTSGAINQSTTADALSPQLASVDGIPYVTWVEHDGGNYEVRVARLNLGEWVQPWNGAGPTSGGVSLTDRDGFSPRIASVAGQPYVAWTQSRGYVYEVRAAHLEGGSWVGAPVSSSGSNSSFAGGISDVGGTPWVAWQQSDGTYQHAHVARLSETGWEQPGSGAGDIGISSAGPLDAVEVSVTEVGSTPYAAWTESSASGSRIRIARFEDGSWTLTGAVGGLASRAPSISDIGGIAYVAWTESDGSNTELRVARWTLGGWEQPWTGVTASSGGINESTSRDAYTPSLASVAGIPLVSWAEANGTGLDLRVARVDPELTQGSAFPGRHDATLQVDAKTYGLPFRFGFRYSGGPSGSTAEQLASSAISTERFRSNITGLSPSTIYEFRPFARSSLGPPIDGEPSGFITAPEERTDTPGPAGGQGPVGAQGPSGAQGPEGPAGPTGSSTMGTPPGVTGSATKPEQAIAITCMLVKVRNTKRARCRLRFRRAVDGVVRLSLRQRSERAVESRKVAGRSLSITFSRRLSRGRYIAQIRADGLGLRLPVDIS